jgi:hypothetical protein
VTVDIPDNTPEQPPFTRVEESAHV